MKKILLITLSIIAVSLGVNYGNVFADEPSDISVTLTPSTTGSVYICGGTSENSCNGYSYLLVNINSGSSIRSYDSTITANFYDSQLGTIVNGRISASELSDSAVISLASQNITSLYFTKPAWLSDGSVTVTLSTSQGCPSCPICPEQLDPNRSPVMDDFHNVFINTMLSVIPITAIIFVVWFFIDMLSSLVFGRGK